MTRIIPINGFLTVAQIKSLINRLDPDVHEEHPSFRAALILLVALHNPCGADESAVSQMTGFDENEVREIGERLRRNGIWDGRRSVIDWSEDNDDVGFWLDVNVGLGYMNRSTDYVEGTNQHAYSLTFDPDEDGYPWQTGFSQVE